MVLLLCVCAAVRMSVTAQRKPGRWRHQRRMQQHSSALRGRTLDAAEAPASAATAAAGPYWLGNALQLCLWLAFLQLLKLAEVLRGKNSQGAGRQQAAGESGGGAER